MLQQAQLKRLTLKLTDPAYRATPFESFGRLRDMGPVVPARVRLIGNLWLITTYDAVNDALKDDKTFCRDPKTAGRGNYALLRFMQMLTPNVFRTLANNMISTDAGEHRRLRSLVDQAFNRHEIEELRPRIEEIVDSQLDEVASLAGQGSGNDTVDLLEHLARPVPLAGICELLGLPHEDRPKFRKWFSSFANINSVWSIGRVVPGLRKTMKYLRGQFEEVRRNPRPGLMSALVQAEEAGDRLTNDELLSMVMLLLLAGHETTVHLLNTSILTMLQLKDVKHSLLSDWSQVDSAVEEMLRYNSPAQFTKPRFVTKDIEFYGQAMKRGQSIMPIVASANYDPARFERPTEFLLNRGKNYHMSFGAGPHVCLGLKLARLETAVLLERLFTRWPTLEPVFDIANPPWAKRMGMRSLERLEVRIPCVAS